MNALSFRTSTENGLSFELLVDGESLGELIGSRDTEIPFWLIVDGLPSVPPTGPDRDRTRLIVTVCSCGEYGCGHAQCTVSTASDRVVLSDFDFDVSREDGGKRYIFSRANYDAVVARIVQLASEHRKMIPNNSLERTRAG